MKSQLKFIAGAVSLLILVVFVLLVINQTAGVVRLAETAHPMLGPVVLWLLIVCYAVLVAMPLWIWFRMPPALIPPDDETSPEYAAYRNALAKRLAGNRGLIDAGLNPGAPDYIERALAALDSRADESIKSAATTVFITTAISQNGLLDAAVVLATQFQIVWRIAHIYDQRPSLRELVRLYAHVAVTVFVVRNIEDLEIEEQVELIISRVVSGSVFGGIPGAGGVAGFVTTSFVNGSVNALLTLRVGVIARNFFNAHPMPNRARLRRLASMEAAAMFGGVFVRASGVVTDAIVKAYRRQARAVGDAITGAAKRSGATVTDTLYGIRDALAGTFVRMSKKGAGVADQAGNITEDP